MLAKWPDVAVRCRLDVCRTCGVGELFRQVRRCGFPYQDEGARRYAMVADCHADFGGEPYTQVFHFTAPKIRANQVTV